MNEQSCWRRSHKLALWSGNLVAALLAVGAWFGASNEILLNRQLPWVAPAVAAVVVAGLTNAGWLAAGRRAVATRQAATLGRAMPTTLARITIPTSAAIDDA